MPPLEMCLPQGAAVSVPRHQDFDEKMQFSSQTQHMGLFFLWKEGRYSGDCPTKSRLLARYSRLVMSKGSFFRGDELRKATVRVVEGGRFIP